MDKTSKVIFALIAAALLASGESADALSYNDIFGKWCGSSADPNLTNITFSRDVLTITHLPTKNTAVLKIDHFDFTDSTITIYYFGAGAVQGTPGNKPFYVWYGNFRPDGKAMSQLPINAPSRPYSFTRC